MNEKEQNERIEEINARTKGSWWKNMFWLNT